MLRTAREIAFIGVMTALLIVAQVSLGAIGGVEIVTPLFLCFCVVFGVWRGMATATAFSLIRCFIWGFFPTVIVLYLVYYNLFAIVFGLLGKTTHKMKVPIAIAVLTVCACAMTVLFTMTDNVITPLMLGMNLKATKMYFTSSLPFMARQTICAAITVPILYYPVYRAFKGIKTFTT